MELSVRNGNGSGVELGVSGWWKSIWWEYSESVSPWRTCSWIRRRELSFLADYAACGSGDYPPEVTNGQEGFSQLFLSDKKARCVSSPTTNWPCAFISNNDHLFLFFMIRFVLHFRTRLFAGTANNVECFARSQSKCMLSQFPQIFRSELIFIILKLLVDIRRALIQSSHFTHPLKFGACIFSVLLLRCVRSSRAHIVNDFGAESS